MAPPSPFPRSSCRAPPQPTRVLPAAARQALPARRRLPPAAAAWRTRRPRCGTSARESWCRRRCGSQGPRCVQWGLQSAQPTAAHCSPQQPTAYFHTHSPPPPPLQDQRLAQMEDALAAREAKREAYLVHRLEASAAAKIQEHRRCGGAPTKGWLLSASGKHMRPEHSCFCAPLTHLQDAGGGGAGAPARSTARAAAAGAARCAGRRQAAVYPVGTAEAGRRALPFNISRPGGVCTAGACPPEQPGGPGGPAGLCPAAARQQGGRSRRPPGQA